MRKKYIYALLALICITLGCVNNSSHSVSLSAAHYGVKADGVSDDGPAIIELLKVASNFDEPVNLIFPEGCSIYAAETTNRYLFPLSGFNNVTIDGNGSTFLLHPDIRFMNMQGCTNICVKNLNIDFTPLPFADGVITGKSQKEGWVDVRLVHGDAERLCGGPTKEDGEQKFFSMLWNKGPYDLVSKHYWTHRIEKLPLKDCLRIHCTEEFKRFDFIEPDKTRISIPVPGIAHRYGPGGCIDIFDNSNVLFENIELWSAPWFGFRVFCNEGKVEFLNVHIRPKPGTSRLTSTWRDGFHVKGNRASFLWDGCILAGMNDDAFNISTHSRAVKKILSPTRFTCYQRYPLNPIPWRVGDEMLALDPETLTVRGRAVVKEIISEPKTHKTKPAAPLLTIETDKPIPNLSPNDTIWQPASTNPDTTLRNCTIKMSCRMQCSMTMESCDVTALLWFYSEGIEGPGPQEITIQNCTLKRGRGNHQNALVIAGEGKQKSVESKKSSRLIKRATITNNHISGGISIKGVDKVDMRSNKLLEKNAHVSIKE